MSYDTTIKIDTGGTCLAEVEDCGNYTSNVSKMFSLAMPGPYLGGGRYDGTEKSDPRDGLAGISGLQCAEAIPILKAGIEYMDLHRAELVLWNPSNNWGNYEGALDYLRTILDACIRHPKAILAVNW